MEEFNELTKEDLKEGKPEIVCREPKYSSPDGKMIDVIYSHQFMGDLPFTATPDDITDLGREIFDMAIKGKFGEIQPYEGRSQFELEGDLVREVRDGLLRELDSVVSNPIRWATLTPENQQELITYRQALLDIPEQEGFPFEVVYPDKPNPL